MEAIPDGQVSALLPGVGPEVRSALADASMPLRAAGPFRQGSFLRTGLRAASEQPRASPQWRRPPPCPPPQAGKGRVGGVPAPAAVVAPPAATGRAVAPSLQAHGYSSPPMKAGASGRERGFRRREVCWVRRSGGSASPASRSLLARKGRAVGSNGSVQSGPSVNVAWRDVLSGIGRGSRVAAIGPARPMLDSTTISVGPPIMSRCSTLSRLIRISRRRASTAAASITASRGCRPRGPRGLSGPAPKNLRAQHQHECNDESPRVRHAAKH